MHGPQGCLHPAEGRAGPIAEGGHSSLDPGPGRRRKGRALGRSLGGADELGGGGAGRGGSPIALEAENQGPVWTLSPRSCTQQAAAETRWERFSGPGLVLLEMRPCAVNPGPRAQPAGGLDAPPLPPPPPARRSGICSTFPRAFQTQPPSVPGLRTTVVLNTSARRSCCFPAQPARAWHRARGRRGSHGSHGEGAQMPSLPVEARAAQQPPC